MKRIHIVGRQNHGKTTLAVELVRELSSRGLRVGTVKHTGHAHEPDVPGKDSFKHREAGGMPAAFVSQHWSAVYVRRHDGDDTLEGLSALFSGCDLVVVEGDSNSRATKIEVWRRAVGTPPLVCERPDIVAVVTDDACPARGVPIWSRRNVSALADRVLGLFAEPCDLGTVGPRGSTGVTQMM